MVNKPVHIILIFIVPNFCLEHQWLQLDLGPATQVHGVVTKGRGDKKNWVTSYSLSYSNDTELWFYYKDDGLTDAKVGTQ